MKSTQEFVAYACAQMQGAGEINSRKMMGEYCIYCDGKLLGLICENQLFIKITQAGLDLLPDALQAPPYEGSKPYLAVSDLLEQPELLCTLLRATWEMLPMPKPKKPNRKPKP